MTTTYKTQRLDELSTNKATHRFTIDTGVLVVDVWSARQPGDASPILLIHGWGGTGGYWASTAAALSETTTVIVPDLPGTGRSQPVSTPQDMFDQVQTLVDLLEVMALDSVQVVGHSMGSAMALLLADSQPQRVERLVLTSLSFFLKTWEKQVYHGVMQVFKLTMPLRPSWLANMPGLPQMMGMRYFHRLPDDNALLKQGLLDYLELDAGTAVACANDAPSDAIPDAGARIQVPTLLVIGRYDQMMPPGNVARTAEIIPDSEVIWIEDCGHMPMIEKPEEYLTIL
jgi:pimeloyl-ACP methyl ester carboxylesterase